MHAKCQWLCGIHLFWRKNSFRLCAGPNNQAHTVDCWQLTSHWSLQLASVPGQLAGLLHRICSYVLLYRQ